ncbi:hsp70 family protein [Mycobacterium xenopi 4042]|uniref:Hsp70 family protein n=1 Tax=Mycobacterium xenopi 4042 TaxID=1299334 RepID=X7Z913_MYCXE|nr:hsp70 family protein [Mycobacterium xenopi 4042]
MYDPLGLSIGTTNLVAARNGTPPVMRRAMLTLYPHRAPELGVPVEDSDSPAAGIVMTGFVERVGESKALVSGNGSTHDPALLLVEALDALIAALGADPSTADISIAAPAHWEIDALRALQEALCTHAGFVRIGVAPRLVSDAMTALTALNSQARLPADGVVALFDFGGGGTSITLANAASGFTPIAKTLRYTEFSGDAIDQALLMHVLDGIGHSTQADIASTAAVGELTQLLEECRCAKERLSTEAATELAVEVPSKSARLRVTRSDLESLIQDRLDSVFCAFDDMLARNNIGRTGLAAVAMAGGVARIPAVAERLSSHVKQPVVTALQPELAPAVGAMMLAAQPRAEGSMRGSKRRRRSRQWPVRPPAACVR